MSSAGGIQRVYFLVWGARKSFKNEVVYEPLFRFCRISTKEIVQRTFQMDKLDEQRLRDKKPRAYFRNKNTLIDAE